MTTNPGRSTDEGSTISAQALPLTLMMGIFFMTFLGRIGLAPLMPTIEHDLGIGHAEAGSFFLLMSAGFAVSLLSSGWVAAKLTHRGSMILSGLASGGAMLLIASATNPWLLRLGLIASGLASGLYLPSSVASITAMIRRRDWGKVLSIQQLAPNLTYVAAPFLAELLLGSFTWRETIGLYGLFGLAFGAAYAIFGRGGDFPGQPPNVEAYKSFVTDPTFWILIALFSVAIGVNQGIYAMVPLYLTAGRGLDPSLANTLVAISRALGFATPLAAGWLADRFGLKWVMGGISILSGAATIWLAQAGTSDLAWPLIIQAMVGVCFFPLGFAALSVITHPSRRNLAIGLCVPIGHFLGGGLVPAGIGLLGQAGRFELGLMLLGGLTLAGLLLIARMDVRDREA